MYTTSTSTCFGRVKAHHQEVHPYVYNNWALLFFLDDCLLCWLDWNNRVKKNQLHAQRILSILRETLHVSGALKPIIRQ